jgi:hypothetical protein
MIQLLPILYIYGHRSFIEKPHFKRECSLGAHAQWDRALAKNERIGCSLGHIFHFSQTAYILYTVANTLGPNPIKRLSDQDWRPRLPQGATRRDVDRAASVLLRQPEKGGGTPAN